MPPINVYASAQEISACEHERVYSYGRTPTGLMRCVRLVKLLLS